MHSEHRRRRVSAPTVSARQVASVQRVVEPRMSPDASRIAWIGGREAADLWVARVGADGVVDAAVTPALPVPLAVSLSHGGGAWCWSAGGDAVIIAGVDGSLWRVDVDDGAVDELVPADGDVCCVPSSAGDHVAALRRGPTSDGIVVIGAGDAAFGIDADFCFDPDVSVDGAVVWHEWDVPDMPWDGGRIRLRSGVGPDARVVTVDGGDGVAVAEPRFAPGGRRLAWIADRGGRRCVWTAELRNGEPHGASCVFASGDADVGGPSWGPGARSFAWAPDGDAILVASRRDGADRLFVVDVPDATVRPLPRATTDGVARWLSWSGRFAAYWWAGPTTPPQVRLVDMPAGGSSHRRVSHGSAPFPDLGSVEHISWSGVEVDGDDVVHGILVRAPHAAEDGPNPLLVWVHGGPTDQALQGFTPRANFFASRGWHVLFVNHRGSTGYGRGYMRSLYGRWGELDVDDVVSGARHLADVGVADPQRTAVIGASAGGYTVLQSLIRHPDAFAAGVALYGIADLERLVATTHRFEAHSFDRLVGPLPDALATYRDRSPVRHAAAIRAPLLVLHGDEDPVVPVEQAELIVAAAEAAGAPVECHIYGGQGHGWGRPDVVVDECERVCAFLDRHVAAK